MSKYKPLTTPQLIRQMDNRTLLRTVNKIRHEKSHPETYGKHGTTRWVTDSEFWGGHHGTLKAEVARRQKLGLIKKTAGKPRTRREYGFGFGLGGL